jgi:hypothetical protein
MFYLRRTLRSVSVAGLLALVVEARAELSPTSPFLPPQGQASAAPTAPPPLELRGVTTVENVTLFSIFDPSAKKTGGWVKLNEQGQGFTVKNYDPGSDTVTVDYQGRSLKLAMRTPKIASSGPAMAVPPVAAPLVMQAPVATALLPRPAVPNPAPTSDAARMAEWTAEIQKRRDMRNQGPGTVPTPQPQAISQPAVPAQARPAAPTNQPGSSPMRSGQ